MSNKLVFVNDRYKHFLNFKIWSDPYALKTIFD